MADDKPEFDPFISNRVFPDAKAVFSRKTKPVGDVKDDALIVLDTNALLVPYTVGKEGLDKIRDTYAAIKDQNRLYVPGQVAREFAKNRSKKLSELSQQFNQKMNDASPPKKGNYPLLESFGEYQGLVELENQVDELLKTYRKSVKTVLDLIKNWTWNDPVSSMYSDLFAGDVVFDLEIKSEDDVLADLRHRKTHALPPGYKDSSKDDEGIGDLLIWLTILEIAKEKKTHMIFVSGDEKSDWWHRSNGQPLYPRYELVNEFQGVSNGGSFHIISFANFLELFGASKEIVAEVGIVESKLSVEFDEVDQFLRSCEEFQNTLYSRFLEEYPGCSKRPLVEMANMLMNRKIVDRDFVRETKPVERFKYRLLHDPMNHSSQEMQKYTQMVAKLIRQL